MTWADPIGDEEWARIHEDFRRCAIRAVVAAQWAVACAILEATQTISFGEGGAWYGYPSMEVRSIAALSTPEEIVDGAA